jgi:cysteinyl-tRNA synthetase
MYACGPTVYERPHLGNARAGVVYDILFRVLRLVYPKVTYVRNITDVDDKIIKAAKENGEAIENLTKRITDCYHRDMAALNCLPPTAEPRATEHISNMIAMIEKLISQGNAYVVEGHVLFDVKSCKNYGRLSRRNIDEMIAGARIEVAPYKKNPHDFVLWKPSPEEEIAMDAAFDSPWSKGRPGWHIECSAMSKHHLGETFDIHGGGADLMFPHHENEIAQSCSANHAEFAKYWVHNGFLTVDGEKMSKSLGNFKTVREVLNEGASGASIRYLYLTAHYRKPLDFSSKALSDANKSVARFREAIAQFSDLKKAKLPATVLEALLDDLNTAPVLAFLHNLAYEALKGSKEAAEQILACCDTLGLDLSEPVQTVITPEVIALAEKRKEAKLAGDWTTADHIRSEIEKLGHKIKDTKNGYEISKI